MSSQNLLLFAVFIVVTKNVASLTLRRATIYYILYYDFFHFRIFFNQYSIKIRNINENTQNNYLSSKGFIDFQ